MKTLTYLSLLFFSLVATAQDSLLTKLKERFDFDIAGIGIWHGKLPGDDKDISLPSYIATKRQLYNKTFNNKWEQAQDNPLFHAAYFMSFNTKLEIGKGLSIFGSLLTEHRGFSYGVNSTSNILIYPQLKLCVDRKIKIGKRNLELTGSVGNQITPKIYEGLTIYNLYQQGHNYRFRYGKFQLHYIQLNDLFNGIGLYTDETYDVITSLEELSLSSSLLLDARIGYSYMPYFNSPERFFQNISFGLYQKEKFRIYSQVSLRIDSVNYFAKNKLALLIGTKWKHSTSKWKIQNQNEFRYFNGAYNQGFVDYKVYYRQTGQKNNYANTVGKHFYPLFMYDRPFSQWAVFTEYQDSVAHDVFGISSTWDISRKIGNEFTLKQQYDFNYIKASNKSEYLYPFYQISFAWEPADGNFVSLGITNKGMNLDMHYFTHYLYSKPTVFFRLQRNLNENWFGKFEQKFLD